MSFPHSNSIRAGFDVERTISATTFTGSYQKLGGVLLFNPVIIIFDNQSSVSVGISFDGINTWKTFVAAEALVLDMRANHGMAANYTIPLNTQIYVIGAAGTGQFSIAITYAE